MIVLLLLYNNNMIYILASIYLYILIFILSIYGILYFINEIIIDYNKNKDKYVLFFGKYYSIKKFNILASLILILIPILLLIWSSNRIYMYIEKFIQYKN
jgi:hypothetical protein